MAKPRRNGKIFQAPRASFGWLTRMSVMAFLKQFPDDDAGWPHLERVRWPDGPVCPKCGIVAMGTPLEGTHLPMRTWFTALYLLAVSSKGLSSVAFDCRQKRRQRLEDEGNPGRCRRDAIEDHSSDQPPADSCNAARHRRPQ
jgi:hypothetical protein